ncbi:DUF4974 domain-containing protein [Aeoliella sp. ICT_H6.2]|uniref:DUF4974 domain-containing protein n=1 Tax=Aeoliella straminimaris TaxID=2954799 RepID=A0A9X2JFC1_9BACT|nr:DUF4974 domain-containing protein [Aeoliella straminimaris]MCO6043152.1 DUF4974 domain-containing protein [Aeoliella straminimaris]
MTVLTRTLPLVALFAGLGFVAILQCAAQEPAADSHRESSAEAADETLAPVFWAERHPEKSEKIRHILCAPMTKRGLVFQGAPLARVVDLLQEEYDIEVQLDVPALDDLGLSTHEPIDANLRSISLGAGLRILLRQLELVYVIEDEVLLITTEEEAWSHQITAVYPVGDLLQPQDADGNPSSATMDDLIDLIISNTRSDRWTYEGGPERYLSAIQPGLLVVSVNQDLHEQIQQLLAALRAAKQHEYSVPWKEDKAAPKGFGGGSFP